jgi:hypothetical protein
VAKTKDAAALARFKKVLPREAKEGPVLGLSSDETSSNDTRIFFPIVIDRINEGGGLDCTVSAGLEKTRAIQLRLRFNCLPPSVRCDVNCTLTLLPLSRS